mgnify:CR=1 FL=1
MLTWWNLPCFSVLFSGLKPKKLEWGNSDQLNHILLENPEGFDLVLGADIYIQITTFSLLDFNYLFSLVCACLLTIYLVSFVHVCFTFSG